MTHSKVIWIDRKFSFDNSQNTFSNTLTRLKQTPQQIRDKIEVIPFQIRTLRFEATWSIQQNIGHLFDLEELWQGRLEDILEGKETMRPWDIENSKTRKARYNRRNMDDILNWFEEARNQTVEALEKLEEADLLKASLHPRLKQPMRMMDLFYFVAEHDDHHLSRIDQIHEIFDNETFRQ